MKKTLVALAVLGTAAGVAHAQSSVTIYGIMDTGFVKQTGQKVYMAGNVDSRLGFRGVEDMGGGLKATFELEKRFNLADGTGSTTASSFFDSVAEREFDGPANVGLAGSWGAIRLGRVENPVIETIRAFDPFNEYGIGARERSFVGGFNVIGMGGVILDADRLSNSARYDSPKMNGVSFSVLYQLRLSDQVPGPVSNEGYTGVLRYDNGPLALAASYDKRVNSLNSKAWSLAGAYAFGPARISLVYENAKLMENLDDFAPFDIDMKQKNLMVGLSYKVGNGTINASYQHLKYETDIDVLFDTKLKDKKYALGYTCDLSKRTSLYANVSHVSGDFIDQINDNDSLNAVQVGMTHKF